jgi:hypothetical protein
MFTGPRTRKVGVASLLVLGMAAGLLGAQPAHAALPRENGSPRTGSPTAPLSASALPGSEARYPGPYQDLSDARRVTISDLLELGDRGGLERSRDLGTDVDPGVDPPYDPTEELQNLKQPWSPPTGPDEITSAPRTPPTGPGTVTDNPPPLPTPFDRVRPVSEGCIGSKFVYKANDGQWLPGFGWRVRVWTLNYDDIFVESYVEELDSFGEWEFCPGSFSERDTDLLYGYESANRLVEVIDNRFGLNIPYFLGGYGGMTNPPQQDSIYVNLSQTPWLNEPGVVIKTKALDTGGPDFYGANPNYLYALGDIMRWSMEALTTAETAGIKVQRSPIAHRILYPNTTHTCTDDINDPAWSCYSHNMPGSPIHLAFDADHVRRMVVQHELAHSIAALYLDKSAGGKHDIDSCSTKTGLAYHEGFANFFAIWSHTPDRTVAPYVGEDPINIEAPGTCGIVTGEGSEAWVAAALWDLHDHHADGGDTLGAKGFGGIVALYLSTPAKDITELRDIYLTKLSPSSQVWAKAVFSQNFIH